MIDIFISYKREEQPLARKLADALQKKGWTVWWDPEIRAGERFDDVIERALIDSKCVVVLWSKLSVESQYVKDEATYALNRNKLVPILIEEVNLPFRFERINTGQLIDWDGSDIFPGFQKLIVDVISILGEPPVEVEKRKREQAEREAERKRREDEQRKAEAERQRLEQEKQRLADEKRKFEEEQKRIEAARKAEEERKLEEERKAEEEREKKEIEARRREKKAKIKPDMPEPVKIKSSEPRKSSNLLKYGVLAGVAVLLLTGIWWWVFQQHVKEFWQEIEKHDRQALNLENAVAELDKPEQIEELTKQRDTLSRQVENLIEQAAKVGLESQLEQIQDRLKQIQIQLANKEKDLIAVRKGNIFVATAPMNATVKILNFDEPFRQGIELAPGKYHVQVSSEGYEPQERWIEIGAGDEKRINFELITISPKVGRLFVETYPKDATVSILNIKQKFFQGMELKPGRYHVEVAAEGYETGKIWIDLVAGHEEPFKFELAEIQTQKPVLPKKVFTNKIGLEFVLIPAGSFRMGSSSKPEEVVRRYGGKVDYYRDEYPQHEVIIDHSYYLQTTPVTVGQWRKFTDSKGETTLDKWGCGGKKGTYWDNPSFKQNDGHPVTCVDWFDVHKFVDWLNEIEGKSRYRLPTEAEWEYACRAGTSTDFSFGNDESQLPKYAWFIKNANGRTHPVANKLPNPWGLYDMHGNVWEWVQDNHKNYNGAPSDGSPWEETGSWKGARVIRGGSWSSSLSNIRSASRSWLNHYRDENYLGFRVARSIITAP